MNALAPGTTCFLVHVKDFSGLNGRVVEVIAPTPTPPDDFGDWYTVCAAWTAEMFPGQEVTSPRRNLRPINPPEFPSPAARKRTTGTVEP